MPGCFLSARKHEKKKKISKGFEIRPNWSNPQRTCNIDLFLSPDNPHLPQIYTPRVKHRSRDK